MQEGGAIHMKHMRKTLLFDVSTNVMFVGYAKMGILVDHTVRIAVRDHAKYLVDRIDSLLKRNKLKLEKIDEIIVGYGPGSYTGIRIAVMVAKMLGYTKNIPVKTVSSLFFMTSGYEGKICAAIDARRGYVFSAVYENGITHLEDGYRKLTDLYQEEAYQGAKLIYIDDRNYEILVSRIINEAKLVDDIHALEPLYLRKTEAETNYDQKSQS